MTVASCTEEKLIETERWGTFGKSIRIIAWMMRFIRNVRVPGQDKETGDMSLQELNGSKVRLFLYVQQQVYPELVALRGRRVPRNSFLVKLSPFIGEDGLLRETAVLRFRLQ